jgi:hypothetical protein
MKAFIPMAAQRRPSGELAGTQVADDCRPGERKPVPVLSRQMTVLALVSGASGGSIGGAISGFGWAASVPPLP